MTGTKRNWEHCLGVVGRGKHQFGLHLKQYRQRTENIVSVVQERWLIGNSRRVLQLWRILVCSKAQGDTAVSFPEENLAVLPCEKSAGWSGFSKYEGREMCKALRLGTNFENYAHVLCGPRRCWAALTRFKYPRTKLSGERFGIIQLQGHTLFC